MMKRLKKLSSPLLALALSFSLAVPALAAAEGTFADVAPGFWAAPYVETAREDRVIAGTGEYVDDKPLFAPDAQLTAGQFAAIVTQAFCWRDLDRGLDGPWYAPFRQAAEQAGLMEGTGVTDWEVPMTRYQMAVMLYRLAAAKQVPLPSEAELAAARERIADWDQIPEQYRQAVASCFALGLLSGVDGAGTFAGEQTLIRAQAAVVYCKLDSAVQAADPMEHVLDKIERKFKDSVLTCRFDRYPGPEGTVYVASQLGALHGGQVLMGYVDRTGKDLDIAALLPSYFMFGANYLSPSEIQFSEDGTRLTFVTPIREGTDAYGTPETRDWGPTRCTVDLISGTMGSMIPVEAPADLSQA